MAWQIGAAAAVVGAVAVGLALALPGDDGGSAPAPGGALFSRDSPWNRPASTHGKPVRVPRSWIGDFNGENGDPLGIERSWEQGKAVFQARRSDPKDATFRLAPASQCFNDPNGCRSFQPEDPDQIVRPDGSGSPDRIPIPRDVRCPGLPKVDDDHDRALVVISADRKTAWEFWHCTHVATRSEPWYTAAVATRWDIDSHGNRPANSGYQDEQLTGDGSPSARGSGIPLVITTITPSEALRGIDHAIGLTVNEVDDRWVNPPASHSDGCRGCSHLRYGMLFVLDPKFDVPRRPPHRWSETWPRRSSATAHTWSTGGRCSSSTAAPTSPRSRRRQRSCGTSPAGATWAGSASSRATSVTCPRSRCSPRSSRGRSK